MKRRRFMQALAAAPAVPALVAQSSAPPAAGREARGGGQGPAIIELGKPDEVAETVPRFFTAPQFSALQKLSEMLMPAMNGSPGAVECGAPEFLDFLIGVSAADRQEVYRGGLDGLNAEAMAKFGKPFAELDAGQADTVIRPLLVAMPWVLDEPKDPAKRFMALARQDIATAARNSKQWADAGGRGGGRVGRAGQLMWLPIDPVYKGQA